MFPGLTFSQIVSVDLVLDPGGPSSTGSEAWQSKTDPTFATSYTDPGSIHPTLTGTIDGVEGGRTMRRMGWSALLVGLTGIWLGAPVARGVVPGDRTDLLDVEGSGSKIAKGSWRVERRKTSLDGASAP